jgi:anti-sigma factor RsiW
MIMRCEELQPLQGPYLDSELDADTTLAVQQHLGACADCARVFAEQEKLQARMTDGLKRGERTAALWERVEQAVLASASPAPRSELPTRRFPPAGWRATLSMLARQLGAGLRSSDGAWAGLAAVWAVIVALNFAAPETSAPLAAGPAAPSGPEMRFAAAQKQLLMTELAPPSEPASGGKPKSATPGPRSDLRHKTLNT